MSKEIERQIAAAPKTAQINKATISGSNEEYARAASAEQQAELNAAKQVKELLSEETNAAKDAAAQSVKSKQAAREAEAAAKTKAPYKGTPGEEIDPAIVDVYRGGDDFNVKARSELKFENGNVKTTHGVSLDTDPTYHAVVSRGAKRVVSIPPELKIIQRGTRLTHFEIVPRSVMPVERYQELLNQIGLSIKL